jgi:hypothetical protein
MAVNLCRVSRIDLVPERRADGTVVFRAVVRSPGERLRRFIRRFLLAG